MTMIQNPILPGFHPDPAICRKDDTYYIATSTFQWWPGVRIHQSSDLVNWHHASYALTRRSQLDMLGNPDSGGIWAPCLTYHDGLFWLVYTNSRTLDGAYKDTPNYLVTAENIEGPWSEPIYLMGTGFDPSLFHDDDGKKWVVVMVWDHRPGKNRFNGIHLQQYDHAQQKLVGPIHYIFEGTELGCTEGPHLYKKDGYYYLMLAEGGTGYNHAVSIARSKNITGPYEVDPANPMLTSRDTVNNKNKDILLQRAGHASWVDTPDGEHYLVHLCSRPLPGLEWNTLGRETGIQQVHWTEEGWLRLTAGGNDPQAEVPMPKGVALSEAPAPRSGKDDFDTTELGPDWNSLRIPLTEDLGSLSARPGWLRLYGHQSMESNFEQAFVARRVQAFHFTAETKIEFEPKHFQEMAGLTAYYGLRNHIYLRISHEENHGKTLCLTEWHSEGYREFREDMVKLPEGVPTWLKIEINYEDLQAFWSPDGEDWRKVGPVLKVHHLSDEGCHGWGFTGMYTGICCQDLLGFKKHADFDFFNYIEMDDAT